jgi:hypothetical protein
LKSHCQLLQCFLFRRLAAASRSAAHHFFNAGRSLAAHHLFAAKGSFA